MIVPTVSNASAIDLIDTGLKLGLLSDEGIASLDINRTSLADLSGRFPEEKFIQIWQLIDTTSTQDGKGLAVGKAIDSRSKGVLASWVSQADNLLEALHIFIDNISLMNPSETWELEIAGNKATLTHHMDSGKAYPTIAIERSMSAMMTWGKELAGHYPPILSAHFRFAAPKYREMFHEIFGRNIYFESPNNTLVFDRSFLEGKVLSRNAFLRQLLEERAKAELEKINSKKPFSQNVERLILSALEKNTDTSSDLVASSLNMSRQTLHRKLKAEGTSYKSILDSARSQLAKHLLEKTSLSISTISLQLGYKDTSAFYKAFSRWFDQSPSDFRNS